MEYRQSDSRIVPQKVGNATGGKSRGIVPHNPAMQSNIKEETLSVPRDRRNNGNEIGENITIIERKSQNGIHIYRSLHR